MTASELAEYFSNRKFFSNPDQEVRFVLAPDDVPREMGSALELRGSVVPETGVAVVALRPARKRRYMFSLKFEANPVIEAESPKEAEKIAYEMMRDVGVTRQATSGIFEDVPEYEAQEPYFLEEVKE